MESADRAVLSDLDQVVDLAQAFPHEQVEVVVDSSHVRRDPDVRRPIERAGSRVPTSRISGRFPPLRADVLPARGSMGEGCIDFPPFVLTVDAAGHRGDAEVEMSDADVRASPGEQASSPGSCGAPSTSSSLTTLQHEHPPVAPNDPRSAWDTTAAPVRTNPASFGR